MEDTPDRKEAFAQSDVIRPKTRGAGKKKKEANSEMDIIKEGITEVKGGD